MFSFLLVKIAKQYLKKYNPKIMGIVSNFTDTTTARAVFSVLNDSVNTVGIQNNQTDLLLNLINAKKRPKTILGWLSLIIKSKFGLIVKNCDYPPRRILDFSRVKFKEMNQLLKFLSFDAAVINQIQPDQKELAGNLPALSVKSTADGPTAVDAEKQRRIELKKKNKILTVLDSRGWAIANIDDQEIFDLLPKTKASIFSFSQKTEADLRALEILELDDLARARAPGQNLSGANNYLSARADSVSLSFKLIYKGSVVPIKLSKFFTPKKIPAVLAGISAGILQGLDMVKIAERLEGLES